MDKFFQSFSPILVLTIGLMIQSCGGNTNEHDNKQIASVGANAFKQQCAVCHGSSGNLMMGGAKDLTKSTMNDAEIRAIIQGGKGNMPEFSSKMSEAEIAETVKFVLAFRN